MGRARRGCATHADRAQTEAHPSAAASANQPSARPARPLPRAKPARHRAADTHRNDCHSAGEPSANQAAMPKPNPTTNQGGGSCARVRGGVPPLREGAEIRVFQKLRARCGRGASPMLGALVHCITWPPQKESALERKRQSGGRRHPLRPLADRLPAHRQRPDGPVFVGVRASSRRKVPAPHRGYRSRAFD